MLWNCCESAINPELINKKYGILKFGIKIYNTEYDWDKFLRTNNYITILTFHSF